MLSAVAPLWGSVESAMSILGPAESAGVVLAEASHVLGLMIWRSARLACPGRGVWNWLRRLRFLWRGWRTRSAWAPLRRSAPGTPLAERAFAPSGMVKLAAWPYLHCGWTPERRVQTVVSHYRQIERWHWLHSPLGARVPLARLGAHLDAAAGLSLQIDRAPWFPQEGELTLSLFEGPVRLYSLVFTFGEREGAPALFVGGIQGRSLPGINEHYAALTRVLHGCRPRDLMVHAILLVGEALGFDHVLAVSDACRQHRDPSRFVPFQAPSADYDEVWTDRGGTPTADGFYALPTTWAPRPLDSVPARKRAMYRRRQALLAELRAQVQALASANRPPRALVTEPER